MFKKQHILLGALFLGMSIKPIDNDKLFVGLAIIIVTGTTYGVYKYYQTDKKPETQKKPNNTKIPDQPDQIGPVICIGITEGGNDLLDQLNEKNSNHNNPIGDKLGKNYEPSLEATKEITKEKEKKASKLVDVVNGKASQTDKIFLKITKEKKENTFNSDELFEKFNLDV